MLKRTAATAWILVGLVATSLAQPSDWPVVEAKGHFTFSLPTSMELASGTFRSSGNGGKLQLIMDGGGFSVRGQPKGLNAAGSTASRIRSASIVVDVQQGAPGDYASLGANLEMPADELRALNDELKSGFTQVSEDGGDPGNVNWIGTDVVQLEQTQAIRIRYSGRVSGGSADFVVNMYMVQNYDCMYYITLSHLQGEQSRWAGDLRTAFESMRFVERK